MDEKSLGRHVRGALLPSLAFLITMGFFGSLAALFWLSAINVKLDDNSRDVLIYAFGMLSAAFSSVVNFVFGSSQGGRAAQAVIAEAASKGKMQ